MTFRSNVALIGLGAMTLAIVALIAVFRRRIDARTVRWKLPADGFDNVAAWVFITILLGAIIVSCSR